MPTSSGRSISARPPTCLRTPTCSTSCRQRDRSARFCRSPGVGSACLRHEESTKVRMATARELHVVCRSAGSPDLTRRGRITDLRGVTTSPRRQPPRSPDRSSSNGRSVGLPRSARRCRLPTRDRGYDVGAYLWIEAAFLVASASPPFFSSRGRHGGAARSRRIGVLRACGSNARSERCTRDARIPVDMTATHVEVRADNDRAGVPSVGDLARRPRRRGAPVATSVLCARPAPLSRDARAVHGERIGRARGVLRQLPRQAPVPADPAFATGFLFFLLSTALALPGAAIVLWQSFHREPVPKARTEP